MALTPTRLARLTAAADAGDTVWVRSSEVRELVRVYRARQEAPRRREPVVVGDLAQVELTVTVPAVDITRYRHKGVGLVWAYDLAAVAAAVGISEAKARRIAKGEYEGLQLRPGNLADVLALYDAVRRPQTTDS